MFQRNSGDDTNSRRIDHDNDHAVTTPPRKVGPGDVTLTGNQIIDEVVANTRLTVIDGQVDIGILRDNVTVINQRTSSPDPLNIKIKQILGIVTIESVGKVSVLTAFRERVIINAADDIQANSIGNTATLTSQNGSIRVKSTGDRCRLTAAADIQAENIASYNELTCGGNVDVSCVGNYSSVNANGKVNIKNSTGANCAINSNSQEICIGCGIGANSAVHAKKAIVCRGGVDAGVSISSETDEIKVSGKVDDGAAFNADKKITIGCGVGAQSVLVSVNDIVDVHGTVETGSFVRALNGVVINGELEQAMQVDATNGPITVEGIIGSESQLQAIGLIKVKGGVQNQASLLCLAGTAPSKIDINGNVSPSAILTADQVYINGVLQGLNAENTSKHALPINVTSPKPLRPRPMFWERNHQHHHAPDASPTVNRHSPSV